MIEVFYKEGSIILIPENMDENEKIMQCVKTIPGTLYKDGKWSVPESQINTLNVNLKPLSDKFKLHSSFIDFVKRNKLTSKPKKKLIIRCDVIQSRILGSDVPHKEIEDVCKFFWKPAVMNPRFKAGKWDGYINLYKKWKKTFPTGLLYRVEEVLKNKGIDYEVQHIYEQRPQRQFDWKVDDGLTPDPDQVEAVEAGYQGLRGVLKAPTGFGKTAILAKRLTARFGVPTLFIANKKSLLDDAAEEFITGIKGLDQVAEIKEGNFGFTKIVKNTKPEDVPEITAPVVVATIQSLHARLQDERTKYQLKYWLNNVCKFVMVDECQAVGTTIWDEVLNECRAPIRIMLSATPKRTDGAKLKIHAQSGPMLFDTTAEEQIEKGRLCELDIEYRVFDHGLYNESDTDIQYHEAYQHWIVENEKRNMDMVIKPTLEMLKEERLVLILITYIDHGFILKNMLIQQGIDPNDIRFVYGNTKDEIRKSAISEFRKGAFKVLIGSTIFDAGVNIPAISGVILAGAGNSEITHIQRIGRGARNVDYEEALGYLPKFMLENDGTKITKVIDIFDDNVKFFKRQAWNRYKITVDEFGKDRVRIVGQITKGKRKKNKTQAANQKVLDAHKAQLNILKEFAREADNDTNPTQGTTDNPFKDIIDAFKR